MARDNLVIYAAVCYTAFLQQQKLNVLWVRSEGSWILSLSLSPPPAPSHTQVITSLVDFTG